MTTSSISDLERELQEARDALSQRDREYNELSSRYSQELHDLRQYLDVIAAECQRLKVSRNDMLKKASEDRSANKALNDWKVGKDGEIHFLESQYHKMGKEADKARSEVDKAGIENIAYISKIFSLEMQLLLANNPGYNSIPFYYNGVGRSPPIYTQAFNELFLNCLGVSEDKLRNLSLRGLLDYVELGKRRELGIAFFHGERLRKYGFSTYGENPRELVIHRSYPVFFKHFKKGKVPIGVGLFFIDPQDVVTDEDQIRQELVNIKKFSRDLLRTVKGTTNELYVFKKYVQEDENPEQSVLYPV